MLGSPQGPLFRVMAGIAIGSVFLLVVLFIQSRMVIDPREPPFAAVAIFGALGLVPFVAMLIVFIQHVTRADSGPGAKSAPLIELEPKGSPLSMKVLGWGFGILGVAGLLASLHAVIDKGPWLAVMGTSISIVFIVTAIDLLAVGVGSEALARRLRGPIILSFAVAMLILGPYTALHGEVEISLLGLSIHHEVTRAERIALAILIEVLLLIWLGALWKAPRRR